MKVLHTTQDIKFSIKSTLFENIPAPLLHTLAEAIDSATRVSSVVKLVFLCSRDASEPEIVFVDIQKHRQLPFGHINTKKYSWDGLSAYL